MARTATRAARWRGLDHRRQLQRDAFTPARTSGNRRLSRYSLVVVRESRARTRASQARWRDARGLRGLGQPTSGAALGGFGATAVQNLSTHVPRSCGTGLTRRRTSFVRGGRRRCFSMPSPAESTIPARRIVPICRRRHFATSPVRYQPPDDQTDLHHRSIPPRSTLGGSCHPGFGRDERRPNSRSACAVRLPPN